ncbi:DUF58 domain-containing protein [Sporolactobacillus shoreae]|uniref:DUF58 domain-containing protein n=1 Tax=Sporolactobacillus shoreae TaxID=1465501 RepID=A0A4Z0GUX8_9BACL|nr:DUF58 domain-containing protein [Sporolactobacillus shoreae]TGB00357.1 DUF58 domain-containing protein [Sporolactobacillus shoreae]
MNWSVEDQKTQIQSFLYTLGFIVFLLGFFMNTLILISAGLFLLGIAFLSKKYLMYMVVHFYLDNSALPVRLSTGESGRLVLTFINTSRFPFLSMRGEMTADENVRFSADPVAPDDRSFHFTIMAPANRKTTISCPVYGLSRGTARIQTLAITCEDPFHVFRCTLKPNEMIRTRIIVYPKPEPVHNLNRMIPADLGFNRAPHSLIKDYTLPTGIRDYEHSDPFRHIHWKATARLGKLQTKTFEQVAQVSWTFLFLSETNYLANKTTEDFERRLSAAAFMTEYACRHHYPYDIYCNNKPMGLSQMTIIEENQGMPQLKKAWELFAFMQKWQIKTPIDRAVRAIRNRLSGKRIIFIMDFDPSGRVHQQLYPLLKEGHSVYQLVLSENSSALTSVNSAGGVDID